MEKKSEPTIPGYRVSHRNIKYPRLEFRTGTLQLILPKGYPKEKELIEKHSRWIKDKNLIIQEALTESHSKEINERRTREDLRNLVSSLVAEHQSNLETRINKVMLRKMKTKWASHSQNHNLTINTLLKYLPQTLIEYVTYHEIIHAKLGRKHDANFWSLVKKKYPNHQKKETELLAYWFLIQEKLGGS
jgi:hypothetical protein